MLPAPMTARVRNVRFVLMAIAEFSRANEDRARSF